MNSGDYPHEIISVKINDISVNLASVVNPDSLFDQLLKKNSGDPGVIDEQIPYWAELWPSAIALSEYIVEHKDLFVGNSVLEIGCGLGLPGIVAGMQGAKVTLTDYLQGAIEFAAFNWQLNLNSVPDVSILDWRNPPKNYQPDILLASDVAYESRSFEPLAKALGQLVKPGGIIIISEPNRKFAKSFFDDFSNLGYEVNVEDKKVIKNNIAYNITIYQLRNLK